MSTPTPDQKKPEETTKVPLGEAQGRDAYMRTPPATVFYDQVEGRDPLQILTDLEVPKLTQEILATLHSTEETQPSTVEAVLGAFAQGLVSDILDESRDLEILQKLKDISGAISSSIQANNAPINEKTAENLAALSRSAILLAGRLREQAKKPEAAIAVEAALRLANILNNVSTSLELLEQIFSNKVFENEYLSESFFIDSQKDFKHIVFGQEGPLHSIAVPKEGDCTDSNTHVVMDQTRIFVEYGKNFVMYQRQPIYKGGKLCCEQMYKYSNSNHQETFYYGGNIWVTQSSDIGPINLKSKSYSRDWSFSHQKHDRLSPKADERLKNYSTNLRRQFFRYCSSQYGTFYLLSFYEENGNVEKKVISITNYEFNNQKYSQVSPEREIPINKDGKVYGKWIEGVKEGNVGFMGNSIIFHSKKCDYWVVNPKTGELQEIGKSPHVINGVDSTKSQVCRYSEKDKGLYFSPCDVFSNYDCLYLLKEATVTTSSKEGFSGIRALGLLEHDDSYDDAQSDSGSSGLQEVLKPKVKVTEEEMENLSIKIVPTVEPVSTTSTPSIGKIDRLASFLLCISNQLFRAQFSPKPNIPKSSMFNSLLTIMSNWSTLKQGKASPSIAISLLHILHCLVTEVCRVQDNRSSGLKVISQEIITSLLNKLELIEGHESAGKSCANVFKNLKARTRMMLTGLKKKPTPAEAKLAWLGILQERFSIQEQDLLLWLGQTLKPKQDPEVVAAIFQVIGEQTAKGLELEGKEFQGYYTMGVDKQSPNFASAKNFAVNIRPVMYYLQSHPELLTKNKEITTGLLSKITEGFQIAAKSYTIIALSSKNQEGWRWEHREEMEEVLSASLYFWTFFFLGSVNDLLSQTAVANSKLSQIHKLFLGSISPYRQVYNSADEPFTGHQVEMGGYLMVQPPSAYTLAYNASTLFGKGMLHVVDSDGSSSTIEAGGFSVDSSDTYLFVHAWDPLAKDGVTIDISSTDKAEMVKKKGMQAILHVLIDHYNKILNPLREDIEKELGELRFNWKVLQVAYGKVSSLLKPASEAKKTEGEMMNMETQVASDYHPVVKFLEPGLKDKFTIGSSEFELMKSVLSAALKIGLNQDDKGEIESWEAKVTKAVNDKKITPEDANILSLVLNSVSITNLTTELIETVILTPASIFLSLFKNTIEYYEKMKELIEGTNDNPTSLEYLRKVLLPFQKPFGRIIKGFPPLTQNLSTFLLAKRSGNLEDMDEYPDMLMQAIRMFNICHVNGWADDPFRLIGMNKENRERPGFTMFLNQLADNILREELISPGTITIDNAKTLLNYFTEKVKTCAKAVAEFESEECSIDVKEYFRYQIGGRSEENFITWAEEQAMMLNSKCFKKDKVEKILHPPNTGSFSEYPNRVKERVGADFDTSHIREKILSVYSNIQEQMVDCDGIYDKKAGLSDVLESIEMFLGYLPLSVLNSVVPKGLSLRLLIDIACGCYPPDSIIDALDCLDIAFGMFPPEVAKPEVEILIKNASKKISQLFPKRLPFLISMCLAPFNLDLYTPVAPNPSQPPAVSASVFWQDKVIRHLARSNTGLLVAWKLMKAAARSPPLDLEKLGLVQNSDTPTIDSGFASNDLLSFMTEVKRWLDQNFTPKELEWSCTFSETICHELITKEYLEESIRYTQGLLPLHPELNRPLVDKSKKDEHTNIRNSFKIKLYGLIRSGRNCELIDKTNSPDVDPEDDDEIFAPKATSTISKGGNDSSDPKVTLVNTMENFRVIPPLPVLMRISLEGLIHPEKYINPIELPQAKISSPLTSQRSDKPAGQASSPKRQQVQPDAKSLLANGLIRATLLNVGKIIPENCRYVVSFKQGDPPKRLDLTAFPRWILITEIGDFWIDANPAEDSYLSVVELSPEEEKTATKLGLYNYLEGLEVKISSTSPKKFKALCSDTLNPMYKATFETNPMVLVPCLPELNQSNQFYLSTHLSNTISRSLNQLLEFYNTGKLDLLRPVEKPLSGKTLQLASYLASVGENLWISNSFREGKRRVEVPADRPSICALPIVDILSMEGLSAIDKVIPLLTPSLIVNGLFSTTKPKIANFKQDFSQEYKDKWTEVSSKLKEDIIEKLHFRVGRDNKTLLLPNLDVIEMENLKVIQVYMRRLGSLLGLCVKGLGRLPFELPKTLWLFLLGRSELFFSAIQEICPLQAKEMESMLRLALSKDPRLSEHRLFYENPSANSPAHYIRIYAGSFRVPVSQSNLKLYMRNQIRDYLGKLEDLYLPLREGFNDVLTLPEIACESFESVQVLVAPSLVDGVTFENKNLISLAFQRSISEQLISTKRKVELSAPATVTAPVPVPDPAAKELNTVDKQPEPAPASQQESEENVSLGGLFD